MNRVSELISNEIAIILLEIRMTGKAMVDIILVDSDLNLIDNDSFPPDWNEVYNEASLRKLLQIGAQKGWC